MRRQRLFEIHFPPENGLDNANETYVLQLRIRNRRVYVLHRSFNQQDEERKVGLYCMRPANYSAELTC